ncbi:heterokaryon incompatibility protein-domain-containing protein [Xylaria arbuscula]|nr:heterokaryon incompatibility protein-domain-containing protein [Xylaria arbuscula]
MRLLNTTTFELREFLGDSKPEYAILSHTWGSAVDEVSHRDMASGKWKTINNSGAAKITGFCQVARENGYQWGWIDTCCIDQTSSAELSESINSMYRWYRKAHICYALLSDTNEKSELHLSRELLAPPEVEFYDTKWREICTRSEASKEISKITGIAIEALVDMAKLTDYSAATRMSWAAERTTTREEDIAYCLLGIFEVNMPLLYGEGQKAFQRLQEEILKTTDDYTLLAWPGALDGNGALAHSPRKFQSKDSLHLVGWSYNEIKSVRRIEIYTKIAGLSLNHRDTYPPEEFDSPRLTARGLRVQLPIIEEYLPRDETMEPQKVFLLFLNCYRWPGNEAICIRLSPSSEDATRIYMGPYYRSSSDALHFVEARNITFTTRVIYLHIGTAEARTPENLHRHAKFCMFWFGKSPFPTTHYTYGYFSKSALTEYLFLALSRGRVHAFVVCSARGSYASCCLVRNNDAELPKHIKGIAPENMMNCPQSRALLRSESGEVAHCALRRRPKEWLNMFARNRPREIWMKDVTELYTVQIWIEPENEMPVTMHLWDERRGIWSKSPLQQRNDNRLPADIGSDSVTTIAPWMSATTTEDKADELDDKEV